MSKDYIRGRRINNRPLYDCEDLNIISEEELNEVLKPFMNFKNEDEIEVLPCDICFYTSSKDENLDFRLDDCARKE